MTVGRLKEILDMYNDNMDVLFTINGDANDKYLEIDDYTYEEKQLIVDNKLFTHLIMNGNIVTMLDSERFETTYVAAIHVSSENDLNLVKQILKNFDMTYNKETIMSEELGMLFYVITLNKYIKNNKCKRIIKDICKNCSSAWYISGDKRCHIFFTHKE